MGVGGCYFESFLDVHAGVGRFIGSFTLRDAVVLGGLLCLTSTLVCEISLWGDFFGFVFCLKISSNFLIECNVLSPMNANGDVCDGSEIASIRPSASLFADFLLDITGILLCLGENSIVSAIFSALVLLT